MIAIDEFMLPASAQLLFGYLLTQGLDFDDTDHLPIQVKRALRLFQNIVGKLLSGHDGSFNMYENRLTLEQLSSGVPIDRSN